MSTYVPADLRRRIRARFADRCAYCLTAEAFIAAIFEIDHIIPRSTGGETVFDNLCLACPTCNCYKASRQAAVAPLLGHTVPLFHPQYQLWEEHFIWNADATIILDLTPIGQATIAALRMNRPALIRLRRMWIRMGEHPPRVI
jgi:HNH endonuclease